MLKKLVKNLYQNQKKNDISFFFLILLFVPFFKPDIVVSFPKLNYIYYALLVISLFIIVLNYIKNHSLNKFIILYIMYFIITLISTIINDGNIPKMLVDFLQNIGIIMAIEIYSKKNCEKLFKVLTVMFYSITILNTLSFILVPEGIVRTQIMKEPIYFLGIDNRFSFNYLPGICVISIYDYLRKNKLSILTYLYMLITYVTFIYFWSAGALVAETLLIIYILFLRNKININPKKYLTIDLIAFISLVFFRIQNLFSFLIVDVLHKDLTLSSRTFLWDKAIKIIKNNIFIGIGVQKSEYMLNNISAYHSHSYFLNILVQSGVFGLISFLLCIFVSLKKLSQYENSNISKIISFTIFSMLIMLLVDTFDITCNMILLLSIGYYVGNLTKGEDYE